MTNRKYNTMTKNGENVNETDVSNSPFSNTQSLGKWDWIKIFTLGPFLIPIKVVALIIIFLIMWCISSGALFGLSKETRRNYPLTGWRKESRNIVSILGRLMWFVMGFHVEKKGIHSVETPILIFAPHTTFFDAIWFFCVTEPASFLGRIENEEIPIIGKIVQLYQPIAVTREDSHSRQKTLEQIIMRSHSFMVDDKKDKWPQIIMSPEGTTSNGRSLITFKKGAFVSGYPVQPIIIQYPNQIDTVTWTWNQKHGPMTVLFITLAVPITRAVVEFLPPYIPNESEKEDPKLYASNVRHYMAKYLSIPTSNVSLEDAKTISYISKL